MRAAVDPIKFRIDRRVIHECVQAAKPLLNLLDHFSHRTRAGHIKRHRHSFARKSFNYRLCSCFVDISYHDTRAGAGESLRMITAQEAGSAGEYDYAALPTALGRKS